jgi:hypothetical protein
VTLEILDAKGVAVRTYSSKDPVVTPHPALDRAAYEKICQQNVSATFCGLPLYWPAAPVIRPLDSRAPPAATSRRSGRACRSLP